MSPRPLFRRLFGATAAAALVGVGLTGVGAMTGAGDASAAECKQSSSKTINTVLGIQYIFEKSAPAQVAKGGALSYSVAVSTTGLGNPYVQKVWDVPPTVLKDVKPTVKVKSFTLVGGILGGGGAFGNLINENVVKPSDVYKDGISWRISHTGWAVFSGKAFVAEFTYTLPSDIGVGTQLTSGGATVNATPQPPLGHVEMGELKACTTVRAPNAGEMVTGSLDENGLGSSEGQLSSTGSVGDMLPGIIGGVIGK